MVALQGDKKLINAWAFFMVDFNSVYGFSYQTTWFSNLLMTGN
jgi:hypothetical protein